MPKKDIYQNFYSDHTNIDVTPLQDALGENANKLSDEKSASLEGEISQHRNSKPHQKMKNNKSPGLDGFTVELFKFFSGLILGHLFYNRLIMAIEMGF